MALRVVLLIVAGALGLVAALALGGRLVHDQNLRRNPWSRNDPWRGGSLRRWWKPWTWMFLALVAVSLIGCMERAVIVPPTVPVRLAEDLKGVRVWVKDTSGREVKARADLFPGMIVVTDPGDFPTETRARTMNLRRDGE